MKIPLIILSLILIVLVIWAIWSYLAIKNLEEPKYTILSKTNGYEVRQYSNYIVAEVEVWWSQTQALNNGFRLLAGYIFGGNTSNTSISMTAPVAESQSTQIAMTVPVSNTLGEWEIRKVQFSMPSKYTLETLPKPNNDKVTLKTLDWYKAAVLRYSFYATESRVGKMKLKLINLLEKDWVEIAWDIVSAQYNPPFSFPALRRNEIIIPIK